MTCQYILWARTHQIGWDHFFSFLHPAGCLVCMAPSSTELMDGTPPLTLPKEKMMCVCLKWEYHIALPGCASNPKPAWFCIFSSPCGLCWYLMHGTCSDPTAKQLKVLVPASVCVCVCCYEREHRPALIPLALDESGASCYSCRAGKPSTANCVCLCVIGAPSHLDNKYI